MSGMSWWEVVVLVIIGFLVFKFVFKPFFKLLAFAALAVMVWLLLMN